MDTKHERNYGNIYPFIRSVLAIDASKNDEIIIIDYKTNDGRLHNFYYPNGSKLFKRQHPLLVDFMPDIKISLHRDGRSDFDFVIISPSFNEDRPNVGIYGKKFIESLIRDNENAYLNFILGESETETSVIDRKDDELFHSTFSEKRLKTDSFMVKAGDNDVFCIHETTPSEISENNIALFKSYLAGYNENSDDYHGVALILGNGVSIPFGADSWNQLINNMLDGLAPYHIDDMNRIKKALCNSSYAISSFIRNTLERDKLSKKYEELLYSCVYRKYHHLMAKENTLVKAVANAKIKYNLLPIYTYNYDTFVEQQYYFECKKTLKHYVSSDYDRYPIDGVIHLHGYIGYHSKRVKDIILTDKDYFDAYLSPSRSTVKNAQVDILTKCKCLFVGSSMSDLFQMSVIQDVAKREGKNWCCFALMCFEDLSLREKIQLIRYYREKGIYLILSEDFQHMPDVFNRLLG